MSGLSSMVAAMGKRSKADDEETDEDLEKIENDMLDEAFAAAQQGDPRAFRRAMKGAFAQCVQRLVNADALNDDEEY